MNKLLDALTLLTTAFYCVGITLFMGAMGGTFGGMALVAADFAKRSELPNMAPVGLAGISILVFGLLFHILLGMANWLSK